MSGAPEVWAPFRPNMFEHSSVHRPLYCRWSRLRSGVSSLGCRHPLGCQTQIQGCHTRSREV